MKKTIKVLAGVIVACSTLLFSPSKSFAQEKDIELSDDLEYEMAIGFGIDVPLGVSNEYEPLKGAWGFDFTLNLGEFYWKGLSKEHQLFATVGLENKSFRVRDDHFIAGLDPDYELRFYYYDNPKMSAIRVFSWNVGLGYRNVVSDRLTFQFGPVFNFNTGSRIKYKYYDGNDKLHKEKVKWGKQTPITVELMGRVDIHDIGIYIKYNPMPLFKKAFCPEFTTLSFGIII